jgi:hypothetical protein
VEESGIGYKITSFCVTNAALQSAIAFRVLDVSWMVKIL